ncbi:MAG: AAA family ATPase [Candidatus Levybacteria bacterium]|nr:AAA family ATPase [Candidatus Levybacteria bacterium]
MNSKFPKGSEWRKWDLQVHTPFSYLNNGFGNNFDVYIQRLFKEAIKRQIAVIGITDYFCIEGYKAVKQCLENDQKLKTLFTEEEITKVKEILILPNIEFRLNKLVGTNRINFHVIFSDKVLIKDIEENFLHNIKFTYEGNPQETDETWELKVENLKQFGEGLKNEHPDFSSENSLFVGMKCAVVDDKQIVDILREKKSKFQDNYLLAVPSDEDLSSISWNGQDHNVRKVILQKSDCLFTSNPRTIEWGLGKLNGSKEAFVKEFKSLKASIWGCDAHDYKNLFEPDKQRYCWIKADATFEGFKQITYEPEDRVFIGVEPEVLGRVRNNKTKYIKSIELDNIVSYVDQNGKWFKKEYINLGTELIAIIGNKGSGKSAVTDIIGLLGNTHNQRVQISGMEEELFSFLNKKRFRKPGYASSFFGKLEWQSGDISEQNLDSDTDKNLPELVEYLPQKYLEKICTEIDDEQFRKKLNEVIFEYIEDKNKFNTSNLNELISYRTEQTHREIDEIKLNLHEKNTTIVSVENKLTTDYEKQIEENVKIKNNEIQAHKKIEPSKVKPPTGDAAITKELQAILSSVELNIQRIQKEIIALNSEQTILAKETEDTKKLSQAISRGITNLLNIEKEYAELLKKLNFKFKNLIQVKFDQKTLDELIANKTTRLEDIGKLLIKMDDVEILKLESSLREKMIKNSLICQLKEKENKRKIIVGQLGKPAQDYQEYIKNKTDWNKKLEKLEGDLTNPEAETLNWLKLELGKIKKTYPELYIKLFTEREEIVSEIFEKKKKVVNFYESIKKAIDEEIHKNTDKLKGYDISIDAGLRLNSKFIEDFFSFVNQSVTGIFYGIEQGRNVLKSILDEFEGWENVENITSALKRVSDKLNGNQSKEILSEKKINSIFKQMKLGKDPIQFYDYLFGLDYMESKYDLKVDNKDLSKLSPGERGGLLLVFYLMLDKKDVPLIIDQPEDNLDNESVYKILVTFLKRAKKHRQIIMVTHNPNLAVVADAEQIIQVKIDKAKNNDFDFHSGSIENPEINKKIVDILEGTMPAFDMRRLKYHKKNNSTS